VRPRLRAPLSISACPSARRDTWDHGLEGRRGGLFLFLDVPKDRDDLCVCVCVCETSHVCYRANGLLHMDCENPGMMGDKR
jgi:hypothetical protein